MVHSGPTFSPELASSSAHRLLGQWLVEVQADRQKLVSGHGKPVSALLTSQGGQSTLRHAPQRLQARLSLHRYRF
jgi:hypothetical protein